MLANTPLSVYIYIQYTCNIYQFKCYATKPFAAQPKMDHGLTTDSINRIGLNEFSNEHIIN